MSGKKTSSIIEIKPYTELPENADVVLWVDPTTQKRFIRWVAGDESDKLPPTVIYRAPHWVWSLYQQGYQKGFDVDQSRE